MLIIIRELMDRHSSYCEQARPTLKATEPRRLRLAVGRKLIPLKREKG